jgi:hypothetical protein
MSINAIALWRADFAWELAIQGCKNLAWVLTQEYTFKTKEQLPCV